jgi:hypothetical protein
VQEHTNITLKMLSSTAIGMIIPSNIAAFPSMLGPVR